MNEIQDIIEGVILEHKDKKDIEILEILEQDLYFKHLKKEDILKYIRETKEIYKGGITKMKGLIKIIEKQTNINNLANIYNQAEKENIIEIKKAVLQRLEELEIIKRGEYK